jgi:predicted TIM-barrel fold metal-dependent hydrolase
MQLDEGQRVSVNLTGLHEITGDGFWVPGVITGKAGSTYSVRVDAPINGESNFYGIVEYRLRPEVGGRGGESVDANYASTERLLLMSNDAHVGAPLDDYRQYCPKDFLEDYDEYIRAVTADRDLAATNPDDDESYEGADRRLIKASLAGRPAPAGYTEFLRARHAQDLLHYDPHVILENMDTDGVASSVFFHGAQNWYPVPFMSTFGFGSGRPYFSGQRGRDLLQTGIRMYNRWMADFCSVDPDRLIGLAQFPMWDVDLAVAEMEWARKAGLRALNFPSPRPTIPDFNELWWEPFWTAAEALDMPLNTHGASSPIVDIASYTGVEGWLCMMHEMIQFSRRGLPFMLFGGVFERHPKLKFLLTEQPAEWVETTLRDLDGLWRWSRVDSSLPRPPSEYFWSNCYVGVSFMSNTDAREAVRQGSTNNLLWGTDFPHTEGTWPFTTLSLRMTAEGIPIDDLRKMCGLNAVELYGLDRGRLQAVAEKIGPTIEEITTPLTPDEIPAEAPWTMAFRGGTSWE